MEVQKQKPVSKKKEARRVVYEKLALALHEYKGHFKEKRFDANLKKASRLFANDLARAIKAKKEKVKKVKTKKKSQKVNKEVLTPTNGVV